MKILHIIESLKHGGAENLLAASLGYLSRDGFPSVACCLSDMDSDDSLLDDLRKIGIKVYSLNMKTIRFSLKAIIKLVSIIKKEKIDIIHTHLFGANLYGRIAGKITGAPYIITTLHNPDYEPYFTFHNRFSFERRRLLDKFTGKFFNDSFIAVSDAVKKSAEKYLGFKNIKVIYNSIDPDKFKPLTKEEKIIAREKFGILGESVVLGSVARLDFQKGHIFLFRALNDRRLRSLNIKLLLAGDGPLESLLKEEAERLKLRDRIIFLGKRKDVREMVGCCDIFILPSVYEGFGVSLLEAMALKIPCLASDVGGIKEIIANGKNGILVKPCSDSELSGAILNLIENPAKRSEIAEAGHKNVLEKFDSKHQIKLLEKIYLNAINV